MARINLQLWANILTCLKQQGPEAEVIEIAQRLGVL